jgi:hypothetical protein
MTVEFLYFRDCPARDAALGVLERALAQEKAAAEIVQIEVPGPEAADRHRFIGSPSIRINGVDLEGKAAEAKLGYGWRCRWYVECEPGESRAVPSGKLIRRRLRESRSEA